MTTSSAVSLNLGLDHWVAENEQQRASRGVTFFRPSDDGGVSIEHKEVIEIGQTRKYMLWHAWFGREVIVKVDGFPSVPVRIRPLSRVRLSIPSSFRVRPIALVVLEKDVVLAIQDESRGSRFALRVCVNEAPRITVDHVDYDGSPILMGDRDVDVSESWAAYGEKLSWPPSGAERPLQFDDHLQAYLWEEGRRDPFAVGHVTLSKIGAWKGFAHLLTVSVNYGNDQETNGERPKEPSCVRPSA